jgi:hypothetical protein
MRLCPQCFQVAHVVDRMHGKVFGSACGLALCSQAKNLGEQLFLAVAPIILGHLLDRALGPQCSNCGASSEPRGGRLVIVGI